MKIIIRNIAAVLALSTCACNAEPKPKPVNEPTNPANKDLTTLSKEELAKQLDKEAYYVCVMGGTERPFANKYWNNHEAGVYVDVISGVPLFASQHKFESGSGWPSFFQPLEKGTVKEIKDTSHGMTRTEVVATKSGAHLGHVFDDGPAAKTGLRYCIKSAALRFVPVSDLKKEGLEKYQPLFDAKK